MAAASLALLAAWLLARALYPPEPAPRVERSGTPEIGGPFTLTAHTGERVSRGDFAGRYRLIYFGYSYCPDVCPAELAKMSRALDLLETRDVSLAGVQPLFIAVDPARDTPERLRTYVQAFHPGLLALTGSPEEIASVAKAYAVHSRKVPGRSEEAYLMDHTSMIFLMGPDGAFEDVFTARESAEQIADALGERLR